MEILIELTAADLEQIAGGVGFASLTFDNSASGGLLNSAVATISQTVTATSATQHVFAAALVI